MTDSPSSIPLLTPTARPELYAQLRSSLANSDADYTFPFDLTSYHKLSIDPFSTKTLTPQQLLELTENIALCRDIIVYFTSCGNASGYGGHTGGAYDTVPEVCIYDAFFRACPQSFLPIFFDEAGHRVATQYLLATLEGYIAPEFLRFYRKGGGLLPGHPELGLTPGIRFSSGRLGHLWGTVNGVALANPTQRILLLGSDGSQMEGNNAESARLAVAQNLWVKLVVDDNNVTITGHPEEYLGGFSVEGTLKGHGMTCVKVCDGENIPELYQAIRETVLFDGPAAVVAKRSMAPGIHGVEGTSGGHDAVAAKTSIPYFEARKNVDAVKYLELDTVKTKDPKVYKHAGAFNAMRKTVGSTLLSILSQMDPQQLTDTIKIIDSDLGGSTGFSQLQSPFPSSYIQSGVMERGNFSACAGFGMHPNKQGVFSTFCAFLEMLCSEITMARLNRSNVWCHFSHSGVDDMSDNTCHFGINALFADNGIEENDEYATKLYFPGDVNQAKAVVERTFPLIGDGFTNAGIRMVFTTRSKTPLILKPDGVTPYYGEDYFFQPGKDELIREGNDGYIVSFGDALYRSLDAVETLRTEHKFDVGLVNKPSLNVIDPAMMEKLAAAKFVLVVESFSTKTGLGSKFGTWLLMTQHAQNGGALCKYGQVGTHTEGGGGLWEQAYHQGFDSLSIQDKVKTMVG